MAKSALRAALLIPKTGQYAALGRSMERAAMLAQGSDAKAAWQVFDTGGTPDGAASAAKAAIRSGCGILCGPLLSSEVRPVVAVAGARAPVLAFSNDSALLESGAFLLGITATQGVSAILRYARARGVRRFALIAGSSAWGLQTLAAATAAAGALGMTLTGNGDEAAAIARLGEDERPDAVLVAASAELETAAVALAGSGVQLLGAFQGLDHQPTALASLHGAWLSAPDPERFEPFARSYEARSGSVPGTLAGLAYDAGNIVAALRRDGAMDRAGLLVASGFKGVCGDVRFREDGSAARALAVLAVESGAYRVVARGELS